MSIVASPLLEEKLNAFSDRQKKLLFQNTYAIQLTEGCSTACVDCGAGALAGVRTYLPFDFLEQLFSAHSKDFEQIRTLYLASDPFDYNFDGKTYVDVHKLFIQKTGVIPFVSTALPRGSEKEVLDYVLNDNLLVLTDSFTQYCFINRISIMKSNYDRIQKAFSKMDGYKPADQTMFSDTAITPDFFSQMHNISMTDAASSKSKKISSSQIFVYGKTEGKTLYLVTVGNNVVGSVDDPVTFDDVIKHKNHMKFRHEFMGCAGPILQVYDFYSPDPSSETQDRLRLGERFKHHLSDESIACFHGVVLTPTGAYNYQAVKPSGDHPIGWIKTEITPEHFEVIPWKENYNTSLKRSFFYCLGKRRMTGKNLINDIFTNMKPYIGINP